MDAVSGNLRLRFTTSGLLLIMGVELFTSLSHAASVSGDSVAVDGNTLRIKGQVVGLYGIDVPENGQNCKRQSGKSYNCGAAS